MKDMVSYPVILFVKDNPKLTIMKARQTAFDLGP